MSWLSNAASSITNSPWVNAAFPTTLPFNSKLTGPKSKNQNPNAQLGSTGVDEKTQAIFDKINNAGGGTYGEGKVGVANQEFAKLKSQVQAGTMSMGDYMNIAKAIVPNMQNFISSLAGGGSKAATAVRNAGGDTFNNTYGQDFNVQNSAFQQMGRYLNQNELATLLPSFQGPNGTIAGNAALAQLQQQYKLNPALDPNSPQNTAKPADFAKQVSDTFQSTVGRAPTDSELSHFQQEFSKGTLDSYGLEGVIKQSPEYTNAQDTKFRTGLNDQLASYDATAFQKMGAPQIFSQYAQNGMPAGTSPSLDYALTDLMGKMSQQRSQYLAQLSASQYGGNKDLATSNYQNTTNQMMNNWSNNLNNSQNMSNYLNQRGYQGADYLQQKNDYMNYLNSQPKPSSNMGQLIGGVVGGIGGAMIPGVGAGAGYGIGSSIGGAYNYLR